MASRLPGLVFRLALLVAAGVSAALVVDYFRPLPAFCDVGSGCDQVRTSGYGRIIGVPLPIVGAVGFAGLLLLSLRQGVTAQRLTRALALIAGLTGLLLLLTQAFVLKVFCKLCVTVDTAAIVAAIAAIIAKAPPESRGAERWLWPVTTAVSLLLPPAWSVLEPSPPVPREVASLWVPGKINVVEFADFQCPFCRQLHPMMLELLGEYEGRVNFVRLNMPLPSHSQAKTAALAYCCADDQGKGPPMADALFTADSLSPEACEKLAARLGVSLPEYRACVVNPATEARIEDQMRRVRSAGLAGLPTVWVGDEVIVGLQPIDKLRAAFAQAARDKPPVHFPAGVLWGVFAAALAATGLIAMRAQANEEAR